MLFLNSWRVSNCHIVRYDTNPLAIQEKLRLNIHSLSACELLDYRRKSLTMNMVEYIIGPLGRMSQGRLTQYWTTS